MIYFVLVFGILGVVFAQEPVTQDYIRSHPAHKKSFEVAKPYQAVFDNLMTASKKCYLDKPFTEQITVWGERNRAQKTGNIRIEHVYAMKPHEMYIMVDIKSVAADKTEVIVYNADDTAQDSLRNYQQWANKKPESC